jgi:hypothetical protein
MNESRDYKRDLEEIRSMMERSSKFLSLSGLAGILAGTYALVGTFVAHALFKFRPMDINYREASLANILILAGTILVLSIGTAVWLSYRQSVRRGESFWNPATKRLAWHMGFPLTTGGILILFLIVQGLNGLLAPMTLVFYGLALYNAGHDSYREVKSLGLIQTLLGLVSIMLIPYQLLFWAAGFGILHIVYGIYIHLKYER